MRTLPLLLILALGSGACAARTPGTTAGGPVPRPFPGAPLPGETPGETPAADSAAQPDVVGTALSFRGVPYRNGGTDPASGFDCSGFVQYVFAQHGTRLPREVREQYRAGEKVDRQEVRAGDLIFFETISPGASHVGLAIGGDEFVHAPSSTGVVRVERLSSSYWSTRFVGARRVPPV